MSSDKIQIDEYSQNWPDIFEEEKKIILDAIGNAEIEHIGSTSVPGLSAKPVIDMMMRVENLQESEKFIELLKEIGYNYIPEIELETPDRKFFQKRINDIPKYHLSLTEPTSEYWKEHILFRDYLRKHPESAKEYENIKKGLSEKCGLDYDSYRYGKTDFIQAIIKKAEDER